MRTILLCLAFVVFPVSAQEEQPEYSWLDDLHSGISNSLYNSALWFDDFFDENDIYDEKTKVHAKIRLAWEPEETNLERIKSRVRLRVRLPNLERKVDLIFSDYDENREEGITDEVIDDRNKQNEDDFNVALRWVHKSNKKEYFSSRIGLASEPDIYSKLMYRRIIETTQNTNVVFQPSLYYYADQGWGWRFSGNFEYSYDAENLFQFNNSWGYIQDKEDTKWRHSLLHYHQYNDKHAVIYGIYANGITESNYHLQDKGAFMRFRWQTMRKWLFVEVEPFVHYPEKNDFDQTFGIAFRIEGKFKR
ncbi:hypothetical protein HR060_08740 [Catenovulum sp. SM1970]|uniref:hypothetical protein n=1 Tax=Marinifaba aquimaris TaxID=2741323 RepID=UPI001572F6D4|nr:hypothetical protein [Marinifaba aquimaris]NTS76957.1 hypothetical protein [Marinifaba aquimaris]